MRVHGMRKYSDSMHNVYVYIDMAYISHLMLGFIMSCMEVWIRMHSVCNLRTFVHSACIMICSIAPAMHAIYSTPMSFCAAATYDIMYHLLPQK